MNFPGFFLNKGKLSELPEKSILDSHFMYVRHKPGHDWNREDGLPDFSKIKIGTDKNERQSMNWNIFSIPIWARFNDKKDYNADYAVIAYSVDVIRHTSKFDTNFDDLSLSIIHDPIENNYSHCELIMNKKLSKSQKREIRMTLKHNHFIALLPGQEQSKLEIIKEIINMYFIRFVG
jgi:hypothetical protein